ncbi:DUF3754 domain-containing protein [Pirellulimonas nuda]|nr:DUF3754 domain-containing protein [Pirellulimonas nuda]
MQPGEPPLTSDPTSTITWERPDDRFIPVRADDLARALVDQAAYFHAEPGPLSDALAAIGRVIDQETAGFQNDIDERYTDFNPDRDTRPVDNPCDVQTAENLAGLMRRLRHLLDKANYQQLSEVDIEAVVRQASRRKIRVRINPERVELIEIWIRGRHETLGCHRTWRHPIKGVEDRIPVFRRMAVVARLKEDPHVLVKLFKDIPQSEVEALLPHAEVTMTLLDRAKLVGGSAGALGAMGMKLAKLAVLAGALGQIFWVVLVGVITILLRTFFGYRNVRKDRDWRRTRTLYFQNLANNGAAVHAILATVKQEEFKEALLAYTFCLKHRPTPWTSQTLREAIEAFLAERFSVQVDFDINDAIETLNRLGLWAHRGELRTLLPEEAVRHADAHAENGLSVAYHSTLSEGLGASS